MEDFHRAYAELEPDDRKNRFNPEYKAAVLTEEIERGPQVTTSDLTGIDR